MNKDFHYEGTYAAARIAGFRHNAAAKIAWAAQTVDECTKKNMEDYYPKFGNWNPIYTCETLKDNVWDEASILSDETSPTLRNVRGIWASFHFLPGNTQGLTPYKGSLKADLKERDIRDFLCMCEPNSPLVLAMINRISILFDKAENIEKENLLIMIGILMHVLADTWAHHYFTGTPNACVNGASDINLISDIPDGYDSQKAFTGPTNYSILYLGHGQIGHNPDYGCMTYRYQPSWREPGQPIIKNGPDDFCTAFEQMEWALRCIAGGKNFTFREEYPHPEKGWETCVRDVVTTQKADQSEVWRRQMKDFVNFNELSAYSFAGKGREMTFFQAYAREHQSFVLGYLQSALNIMNI